MKKRNILLLMLMLTAVYGNSDAVYTLDGVEVYGDRQIDRFGNVVTEQSYVRTGGDVQVINADKIAKNQYNQLSDALKYVPGVQIKGPGYRGGEFQYGETHSMVLINGDARVIVLVDGRRMDNLVGGPVAGNSAKGSKATVDINQIIDMGNVDKIEVIKGPGASVYGADATGGVINIITKKGALKSVGTLELSIGSWGRKHYGFSYSGSNEDGNLRYFISAKKEVGGNSWYHDGITDKDYEYRQTGYDDSMVNGRFEYKLSSGDRIGFAVNHMLADDDYPLTAPDYRYLNEKEWARIKADYLHNDKYGDPDNPGYRNLWIMWLGAYSAYDKKNYDLTYSFKGQVGENSFVRLYKQKESYWGSWGGGDEDESAPLPFTPEWDKWGVGHRATRAKKAWNNGLQNKGVQIQFNKIVKDHNILMNLTYDQSKSLSIQRKTGKVSTVERKGTFGSIQDKIKISDSFEITPALRFSHYSDIAKVSYDGKNSNAGSSTTSITPALNVQYAFDNKSSIYLGYDKIYRPLRAGDYEQTNMEGKDKVKVNAKLKDEEGNVFTVGVRKAIGNDTDIAIHYNYTDMSNAVAYYSVWDKSIKDFKMKFVNAKQNRDAFNVTLAHRFNDFWTLSLNYSHVKDKWEAKDGMQFDPELTWDKRKINVNNAINKLRPNNVYTGTLTYDNNKVSASLLANYYTGLNRLAYTSNRFFVVDLTGSYKVSDDLTIYGNITNLTNEAWENTYTVYLGLGAWPQPGRAFMMGAKYKF